MKYPIDTEKYIAAVRLEFGEGRAAEEGRKEAAEREDQT